MHEELKKQMGTRNLKLSLDEERKDGKSEVFCTSRWMMEDMKKFCQKESLGLTYSGEYACTRRSKNQ